MTDITSSAQRLPGLWKRLDKAVLAIVLILLAVALFDLPQLQPSIEFAIGAIIRTAPFIAFAVLAVGYMKATGAESLLAKAFEGREVRMIFLAALMGGLSPFCSCQVIPFIAALLAMGAPLSAVMAFWLSSPLMDPAMFSITAGTLGTGFALGKATAAVGMGLFGGFATKLLARSVVFSDPLREKKDSCGSCCSKSNNPFAGKPVWAFWGDDTRRGTFRDTVVENVLFLGKWLVLAYLIESLMLRYVPAELVAGFLGGSGVGPIILGAVVGAPAYLNGYAAVPLVDSLLHQGMSNGAAMAFMVAGGVSSIPAAIAVWALVKPRVFAAYFGFALVGAVFAGLIWNTIA